MTALRILRAALAGLALAGPVAAQNANPLLDCSACHGGAGRAGDAVGGLAPSLTGQPMRYLAHQLHAYREGKRRHGQMTSTAILLGEGADGAAARLYGSVAPPEFRAPAPLEDYALGRRLAHEGAWEKGVPPCASCHSDDPFGSARLSPRLFDKGQRYLQHELNAYASGERASDSLGRMRAIAQALTEEERAAVAAYYAAYRRVEDDR